MLNFHIGLIHFLGCLNRLKSKVMRSAVTGFSFIEVMGALLIFSLLGTTLIISQGTMTRAVSRITQDVEALLEGRFALDEAKRSGKLYAEGEADSKLVAVDGRMIPMSFEIVTQAFEKEGPFKDFVPGAYGRVLGKARGSEQELFVFILGPNYSEPQDPKKKQSVGDTNKPAEEQKSQQRSLGKGI